MIPDFNGDGFLPPGIHWASWDEFSQRYGNTSHRRRLLKGLEDALRNLALAGCETAYIDGSFVTDKQVPGDFDACWEANGVDPNLLDPVLLDFSNMRANQKAKYKGELFPAAARAEGAPFFRIFIDFFQVDKQTGSAKGIVAINLLELPS